MFNFAQPTSICGPNSSNPVHDKLGFSSAFQLANCTLSRNLVFLVTSGQSFSQMMICALWPTSYTRQVERFVVWTRRTMRIRHERYVPGHFQQFAPKCTTAIRSHVRRHCHDHTHSVRTRNMVVTWYIMDAFANTQTLNSSRPRAATLFAFYFVIHTSFRGCTTSAGIMMGSLEFVV